MADWNTEFGSVDDDVDAMLGDEVQIAATSASPFANLQCFVNPDSFNIDQGPIDPQGGAHNRVKIAKTKLPHPSKAMRFILPQIEPATRWRPENWVTDPDTGGRYWLIDMQKALT